MNTTSSIIPKRNQRNQRGSIIIEFATVAWMLTVAALIGVNCMLVLLAGWQNDAACRDAVRAAAQRDSVDNARYAARAAVVRYASGISLMTSPQVSFADKDFVYEAFRDANGQPQREKGPFVRVSTTMTVKMPAPFVICSAGFTDTINLKQSYAFPIVRLPKKS